MIQAWERNKQRRVMQYNHNLREKKSKNNLGEDNQSWSQSWQDHEKDEEPTVPWQEKEGGQKGKKSP